MKWFKSILVSLFTMIAGMAGGQGKLGGKGTRRFGIFGFALTMDGFQKQAWPLVLLIPILIMGYGEKSFLQDKLHFEWLTRLVYGFILSLPFLFYGLKRFIFASILLVIAFQIHAGSLGHIGFFGDILAEDMLRYGILGVIISANLFFPSRQ